MGGRPWHWIAAGVAAVAVFGAVLVNDTSSVSSFVSQPFTTVEYPPEIGNPIVANPTIDATTVTQTTTTPPPPPPVKPTQTPTKPPTRTQQPRHDPPPQTRWTVTVPLPDLPDFPDFPWYYPDCDTARFFGDAPLRRGHPSYRDDLDDDHDGVACDR